MHIEYSRFNLNFNKTVNRFSQTLRSGVIFRIDHKYFVEYNPWEEFGDQGVDGLLDLIRLNKELPDFLLYNLSLDIKQNEIDYKEFFNHQLLTTTAFNHKNKITSKVIKIKYSNNFSQLVNLIKNVDCRIRIDFNCGAHFDDIMKFWSTLGAHDKLKIDYLEDPCHLTNKIVDAFDQSSVPIACDRQVWFPNIKTKIYKPNIELDNLKNIKKIYSSYMGHDLGRFHTFLALMESGDLNLYHGVNTPDLYSDQLELFIKVGDKFVINKKNIYMLYQSLKDYSWQILI